MQNNNALFHVSRKLQIYLEENELSILKLSQKIPDIKYQTLKRIVEFDGKGSLPNISSLISLADFFNCTISELLSDKVAILINGYSSINDFLINHNSKIMKVHIPIDEYNLRKIKDIFAIYEEPLSTSQSSTINDIPTEKMANFIQIFAKISTVEYDGYYIAKTNSETKILKVISVSTTNLMVEESNQIINIKASEVEILAKFISSGVVIANEHKLFIACQ